MARQIRFEGKIHRFPDDATEDEINDVLGGSQPQSDQPEQPSQSLGSKYKDYLQGLGVGGVQGLSDIGANIAQFPSDIAKYFTGKDWYQAPKPNFEEYIPKSGAGQFGSSVGGFISPFALPVAGVESLAAKTLPRILTGAGIGAAESENRPLGAALGAAFGGLPVAKKQIEKLPPLTSKGISKEILADKTAVKKSYESKYNQLFDKAASEGIKEISHPDIKYKMIIKNSVPKYHESLMKFVEDPTLENAHWAQSDLGKLQRSLESSNERVPLTSTQNNTLKAAKEAKEKIKDAMFSKTNLGSHPELAKEYETITHGYKSDVIPYASNKALTSFEKGEIYPKSLIDKLRKNDKFMLELGKKYPGIKLNQILKSPLSKKIIGSLLTGLGIGEGYNLTR